MNLDLDKHNTDPIPVQIGSLLRRKIETGALAPGKQLPSNCELARLWHVSNKSIQQGVAPLVAEGLLERRRKHGTFVRQSTRKAAIALVFGPEIADETSHYRRAQLQALREQARVHAWTCRVYDGINPPTAPGQEHAKELVEQLEHDLLNHEFKGLIHVALRREVSLGLERQCGLPTVRIEDVLMYDYCRFARESVAFLAGKGCRRLAAVCAAMSEPPAQGESPVGKPLVTALQDAARAHGLPQPEVLQVPWMGSPARTEAEVKRRTMAEIAKWRTRRVGMPDGLIVPDDIVMRSVDAALFGAGARVPQEIRVVTQATDRVRLHYAVPVVRYEFPVDEAARMLIDLLWKKIMNEPWPPLPVLFGGKIVEDGS